MANLATFTLQVREFFKPFYENKDAAHGLDHVDGVAMTACNIIDSLSDYNEYRPAIIAAYAHDIFCENREHHHDLSARWVRENAEILHNLFEMEVSDIEDIANACREHRASYTDKYSSVLSQVISAADRGYPDLEQMTRRSLKFHSQSSFDVAVRAVHHHIPDKYGADGYARYPAIYGQFYRDALVQLHTDIENKFTEEYVRKIARTMRNDEPQDIKYYSN